MKKTVKDIRLALETVYKEALREAMRITNCNMSKVAGGLMISRTTLYKQMIKYFGRDFKKKFKKEFMITNNTAEDIIRLTIED